MEKLVEVALKIAHNNGVFTYRLPDVEPDFQTFGKRVKVKIKNRLLSGVMIGEEKSGIKHGFAIKNVEEIIDDVAIITEYQLDLMKFASNYYFNPLGITIHMAIPRDEKAPRRKPQEKMPNPIIPLLTDEQESAVLAILSQDAHAFLLEGVTGSGKTLVYMKVAQALLQQKKSVLFLVPEISLTPELIKRVERALGIKALVMHSSITPQKKRDALFSLIGGEANVLIGARSAIFAPLKNLGLIVVDEEHDGSLKQDESPRYHARDLALWRAKNEGAHVILGSATPSLESLVNVERGKLAHLVLQHRYQKQHALPEVVIIDLKVRARDVDMRTQDESATSGQKMCILSRPLLEEMKKTLHAGAQVLLFLNQRGYAKFGVCSLCGHMVECQNCSVSMTYYQHRRALLCHQCQHSEHAVTVCRNCKNDAVIFLGLGTERLEEEVRARFPDFITLRLDRDIVRSQRRLEDTLAAMYEQRAHILIGTQMIAKGHDFQHVGLVGVVCADVSLSMPDFRAAEKTFQLLTQVAGRAGRGHLIGRALIQTYNPGHPSIFFAKDHNVKDFMKAEGALRKRFFKPPFSRAALIRSEHANKDVAEAVVTAAKKILSLEGRLTLLGPAPSPIEKINNRYRFQCLLLAQETSVLHHALHRMSKDKALFETINKSRARFIIDVDPQHLS